MGDETSKFLTRGATPGGQGGRKGQREFLPTTNGTVYSYEYMYTCIYEYKNIGIQ